MKSIRCPECDLMDWAEAARCKRCGYAFQEVAQEHPEEQEQQEFSEFSSDDPVMEEHTVYETVEHSGEEHFYEEGSEYVSGNYAPQEEYGSGYSGHHTVLKPSRKMAITSMIFGIIGMPFFSMVWGTMLAIFLAMLLGTVGAAIGGGISILILPIGLIMGIVALVRSNKRPAEYGGKGFAVAGIACNSVGLVMLPLILAIAIPNLMAARRAANEGSAIGSLQTLAKAQMAFRDQNYGRCARLEELGQAQVIDPLLGNGQKMGYRFIIVSLPNADGGCEIMAVPVSKSEGTRSFYYSTEDNILRAADKKGEVANRMDPPLDSEYGPQKPQISSKTF
ncbi:MAG: DUF4190 domain-containing protein [Pyrinomonadaceae bacterium]|nr:DUF4190 domain-containing protein [Pyrinomonadaceae bacterium]